MAPIYILGISAYYHDSAICLLRDGEIVFAAQEERFSRKKHDDSFPKHAIQVCFEENRITAEDLTCVVFYDKPLLKFERILETYIFSAPKGIRSFIKAIPIWIKKKLWIKDEIAKKLNYSGEILFTEHHQSHAASAFYPSPFKQAAFLTMDGVGEWATTSWGVGIDNTVQIHNEIHFPHSLGLLYSAFTYYTGFRVNSGEYKVMGLAPYGNPIYKQQIYDHLIDVKDDGSYRLNMKYFNYAVGLTMTNHNFHKLFDGPPRKPESPLTQKQMDLACSIQKVTEEVMLTSAKHIAKETRERNLCLAGGVALNCVANGKILRSGLFDNIWVQPASGDAGGALGAALEVWNTKFNSNRDVNISDSMHGCYLGKEYDDNNIQSFLDEHNIPNKKIDMPSKAGAKLISNGKVLGWFQDKMEFGPRALGNRSILGDARSETMQTIMNLKIKFRESFRPFAPSVLEEDISEWFDIDRPSPYMLLVAQILDIHKSNDDFSHTTGIDLLKKKRSSIPAITHVDYSARIQSVNKHINPKYHALISEFKTITGCPVIVNTSFNVRGEPIVESPEDAYRCFMRTEMDYLILGSFLLSKDDQPEFLDTINWRQEYALD